MRRKSIVFVMICAVLFGLVIGMSQKGAKAISGPSSECSGNGSNGQHEWVKNERMSREATCTEGGVDWIECKYCGEFYDAVDTPALGHDFGDTPDRIIESSCRDKIDGMEVYICRRCHQYTKEVTVSWSHKWRKNPTQSKNPTCTEEGLDWVDCEVCGEIYDIQTVPALGHDWAKGETHSATCMTEGYTVYICNRCKSTEKRDIIPKGEHKWKTGVVLKNPTCTEEGEEEKICEVCGTEGPRVPIPATGHDWDAGVVTKEPAYQVEGVRTYTCKNDPSHKKTEAIPALTTPPNGNNNNPTLTPTMIPTDTPTPEPTEKPAETITPTPKPTEKPAEAITPTPKSTEKPTETMTPTPAGKQDSSDGAPVDGLGEKNQSGSKGEKNGRKGIAYSPIWKLILILLILLIILASIVLIAIQHKKKGK